MSPVPGDVPLHRVTVARGRLAASSGPTPAELGRAQAAAAGAAKQAAVLLPAAQQVALVLCDFMAHDLEEVQAVEATMTVEAWARDVLEAPAMLGLAAGLLSLAEDLRRRGAIAEGQVRLEGLMVVQDVVL